MVTKDFFTDILTLRYHPDNTTTHVLPKDFISSNPSLTLENNTDILDNMLTKTIKNSIKTKSVAIGLSGGIDSCTILAKIRNVLPDIDIHCITVGFHNSDVDMTSASKIAKYFDCKFHSILVENPLETLPMQISLSEEPRWNTFWTYVVNHAKNYSDVLISGDGGDEVFAGYTFRYSKFLKLLSPNDGWVERTIKYLKCHERDWVDDQNEMFTAKMNFSWNNIYHKLKPYFDNELKPLNQVLLADYNGKLLYDWVPTNYKIHKKLKMNAYFPLLDTEIVHHGLSLPLEQKYNVEKNEGKIPLRLIFEKYGHNDLLLKEKKGYGPDLIKLWETYGYKICKRYLIDSDAVRYGFVNKLWIENAFNEANAGDKRYITKILSILSLEIWCRMYITNSIDTKDVL